MYEVVKLKKRIFKRHALSYWTNIRVGNVENFTIFLPSESAWDPKSCFNPSDLSSVNRAVEIEFTVHQRFFESS